MEDLELEMIMARKKMRLLKQATLTRSKPTDRGVEQDPISLVKSRLYSRGEEVLEAALRQYPDAVSKVVERLADLIKSGSLSGRISGEQLLWLFRQLGLNVRLETRIRVEKDGRLVSLADAVRSKWRDED